jgi:hypothetical protein
MNTVVLDKTKQQSKKSSFSGQFFAELHLDKDFNAGDLIDIQVMRKGEWNHPIYGKIEVTSDTLSEVLENFYSRQRGVDLALDENHEPDHKALGWFKELYLLGSENLYATIELTQRGAELLKEGAYKYFSPEIIFSGEDEETGDEYSNLLIGGAITNRPFFKNMEPLMASEVTNDYQTQSPTYLLLTEDTMKDLLNLADSLNSKETISLSEKESLTQAFNQLSADKQVQAKGIVDTLLKKFNDEEEVEAVEEVVEEEATEEVVEESADEETEEVSEEPEVATEVQASEDETAEEVEELEEEKEEEVDPEVEGDEETPVVQEPVQASEKITVEASSFSELQAEVSKLRKESHDRMVQDKVDALIFSEATKTGSVLPKNRDTLVGIFSDMSEKHIGQVTKFLKDNPVVSFSEIGSDKEVENKVDEELVSVFEKNANLPREYAEKAAEEFAKSKQK